MVPVDLRPGLEGTTYGDSVSKMCVVDLGSGLQPVATAPARGGAINVYLGQIVTRGFDVLEDTSIVLVPPWGFMVSVQVCSGNANIKQALAKNRLVRDLNDSYAIQMFHMGSYRLCIKSEMDPCTSL